MRERRGEGDDYCTVPRLTTVLKIVPTGPYILSSLFTIYGRHPLQTWLPKHMGKLPCLQYASRNL
jgi:hypothetical protein